MKPTTSHHYSALAIAIVVFLASVAGYMFIYYSINQQSIATTQAANKVQDEQRTATRQKAIIDSLKATAADRALISSFLLSKDDTVSFIEKIEGLSKLSGATVSLVSISADASAFHAHVNIQGSWTNMMRSMHLVENLPYSLTMDNVRVGFQGKGIWVEDFDITIPISNS